MFKLFFWLQAMLSMFEMTTGDNWPDVMHTAMDAVGVGLQPVLNHSSQNGMYFVAVICVLYFLMANVFTGVFMQQVCNGYRKRDHLRLR